MTIALARRHLPENQARLGISSLSVTVTTGLGLGYPLTGILADLLGFRFAFWFAALFLITTILVVWRVVPAGPDEQAPRPEMEVTAEGRSAIGIGAAAFERIFRRWEEEDRPAARVTIAALQRITASDRP